MTNPLLVICLVLIIISLLVSSASWLFILLSIALCILIIKVISMEKELTLLRDKLNSIIKGKAVTEKPPTVQPVSKPVSDYVWKDQSAVVTHSLAENESVAQAAPERVSPQQDDAFMRWIKNNLLSGNPIAKIGVLILFFGMAFLIKYVAQHNLFPIELRLLGVALTGLVMVVLGLRLSASNKNYANILSGGGIGLLYLTVFSAFQIYHLISAAPAFSLLLAIVILSGSLAIVQDAKLLAVFGILGGFLAPILISNATSNYVLLFSYYLILNLAILGMALFKSWREMNLIGFIFTFIVSALWGWQSYLPEYFPVVEGFLITFFLFYVAIVIIFALRVSEKTNGVSEIFLTVGNPFIVFGLQAGLVHGFHYGLAWSSFALSIFYFILAYATYLSGVMVLRGLTMSFGALAVLFGTLSIPLAFSRLWTATDWALESIVLLWVGIRQRNDAVRMAAGFIMLASTLAFVLDMSVRSHGAVFFSEYYLSGIFISAALLMSSYLFYRCSRHDSDLEMVFAQIFMVIGCAGWYYLNLDQIFRLVSHNYQFLDIIVFIATSSMVAFLIGYYLNWKWMRYPALSLLPAMIILSVPSYPWSFYHSNEITLAWMYSFAVFYTILYLHESFPKAYLSGFHLVAFLFLTWFIADRIDQYIVHTTFLPFIWRYIEGALVVTVMLGFTIYGKNLLRWPLSIYAYSYQYMGGMVLVCILLLWFLLSCPLSGDFPGIFYMPVFNPLDMTILAALLMTAVWLRSIKEVIPRVFPGYSIQLIVSFFTLICFIWLNAVMLRSLHHWFAIPYAWNDLWASVIVQACLSIFWAAIALVVTFIAARKNSRELWFCGYALIWLVIVKLFLVDLSDTNTLERIITFIGVGVLLLINGYISPLPPRSKKSEESDK